MRTVFLALLTLVWSSISALAAPLDNTYTHHTALAVPEQSFQLAATWFLPDWQAGISARTDIAPDGSGDRHDLTCSVYGGCLGIPANMTCSDDFTVDGKTCYKSCSCKSGYILANSSDICKGCYNPCDAHTAVDTPYGCEKYFSDCASKCEKAYPDNCHNRTAVTDLGFGCEKYFDDCSSKCEKAYADNCRLYNGVDEGAFGCKEYYDDCPEKCKEAYPDNCHKYTDKPLASSCPNGCAQGKTYADCSSKCSVGCKASCDAGYYLSADELSCSYDLCQKYGDKPLVSSCANGCALDTTAEGCSSRCATGCKASCSSPKRLTANQLSCQCPDKYNCDGSDRTKICYNDPYGEDCDGKTDRFLKIIGNSGINIYDNNDIFGINFYALTKNPIPKNGYSIYPINFSFRGKSYSYGVYYRDFSASEKSSPETVVSDCSQLTKAFNDNTITNIRISGHIICGGPISTKANKNIYGSNRYTDKIEFETGKGFETFQALKLSNLSLSTNSSDNCDELFPMTSIILSNVSIESGKYNIFPSSRTDGYVAIMKGSITLTLKNEGCRYMSPSGADTIIDDGAQVNIINNTASPWSWNVFLNKGKISGEIYKDEDKKIEKVGNGYGVYVPKESLIVFTDGSTSTITESRFANNIITGNNVTLNGTPYFANLSAGRETTINYYNGERNTLTNGFSPYITRRAPH